MLVLGEIHRLDEIRDRDRLWGFGLREGEAGLRHIWLGGFSHGCARFRRRKRAERGEGGGLASFHSGMRCHQFLEPVQKLWLDVERSVLLLLHIGDAHRVDGGLEAVGLLPEGSRGPGRDGHHPDQADGQAGWRGRRGPIAPSRQRPHHPRHRPGEAEERHGQKPDQRQDTGDDLDDRDPRLRLRARIEPEFER
jgi:hypothetical protein